MNRRLKHLGIIALTVWFLLPMNVLAVFTIEVNKGVEAGIPIAIVPFRTIGEVGFEHQPADIIAGNLALTGQFEIIPQGHFPGYPADPESVQFKDWRLIKAEVLVVGQIINVAHDRYEVRFYLIDVFRQNRLKAKTFQVSKNQLRKVSHQISDQIYQHFTGKPGAFDTRIAYVHVESGEVDRTFRLQIADIDGYNPKTILQSSQPILSPAWSPDGNWVSYVSFEKKRSIVFVQNIWTGERQLISDEEGINSAPAWSPDGRHLALTLSIDGNPEIYLYDIERRNLRRMTKNLAIDTEASFSPDGSHLVFSSGRGGLPQLYEMPVWGPGEPRRLTFMGIYNAGPSYSPDGKSIVMITDQGNGFRVGIYSTEDQTVSELTDTTQDESPTFAPNGEMIIYATQLGGRDVLAVMSTDGTVKKMLRFQKGSVREPAWSPFKRS